MIRIVLRMVNRELTFDGTIKEGRKWLMNRLIENADYVKAYGPFQVSVYVVEK